jgi:hypothetical protein
VEVVVDLRSPLVVGAPGAGALKRDETGGSVEDLELVEATDSGRAVLSLTIDRGLAALAGGGLPIPMRLEPGALIDVVRAMPVFGTAVVLGGAFVSESPINAANAEALSDSRLSGDGDREVSALPSSTSSFVVCNVRGIPIVVMGRCLGGFSSVGESKPFLKPPDIDPGGNSKLRLFAPFFCGSCESIGSRDGEGSSSMVGLLLCRTATNSAPSVPSSFLDTTPRSYRRLSRD